MFRLGLHLGSSRNLLKRMRQRPVQQKFFDQGWLAAITNDEGKVNLKFNVVPGEKEFKTLVQMFSEFESQGKKTSLLHFDGLVIDWAKEFKNLELADRWLDFRLQKEVSKFEKVSIVHGYLNTFRDLNPSEVDDNKILRAFEKISDDLNIANPLTFLSILKALSLTRRYKDCLGLIEEYNKGSTKYEWIKKGFIQFIVNGALRNDDVKYAAKVLREHQDMHEETVDELWQTVLKHSDKLSVDCTLELLNLIDSYNLSSSVLMDLRKVVEKSAEQWTVFENPLFKRGIRDACVNCGEKMEPVYFDDEKIEKVKDYIYALLMEWNSGRFETLLQSLQHAKDITLVVDGMSLLHNFVYSRNRPDLLEVFCNSVPGRKIIIGRNSFFRQCNKNILENPDIIAFPVNYSREEKLKKAASVDDLFILYVALHYHPNCYIVSEDFMRDHAHKLEGLNLKYFCRRWISSRRLYPSVDKYAEKISLKHVDSQNIKTVAKTTKGWHIGIPGDSPAVWCLQRCGKQMDVQNEQRNDIDENNESFRSPDMLKR